jgi:hypothetical protein
VVKGSTRNCSRPTWKPESYIMVAKVLRIASWVLVRLSPWAQHKRSMGCVRTHQRMPTIEGWGSLSHVWNVVKKNRENNRKDRKTSLVVSQTLALRPEHDKFWARWTSNIPSESMLERVWWCKHSEMESWIWTIYYPMNCSNGGKHA